MAGAVAFYMDSPEPAITSLDTFRAGARAGKAPEGASLRKVYTADSIKVEGGGQYTFTISTGAIDRDRDTIAVAGWHVDQFLKAGGPVLWAHMSRELPIGKSPWVRAQGGALKARVEFAPAEVYPFADMVRGLVDFGALKATSVGFRPLPGKAAWNEERSGIDFMEQELLEFSIVPVPSNPEALLDAKAKGIDLAPLKDWATRALDSMEPGLWISRHVAERALKIATGEPAMVTVGDMSAPANLLGMAKERDKAVDFALAVGKRGRVLSAANEARLLSARTSGGDLCAALDEVLAQLEAPEEPKGPPEPTNVISFRQSAKLPITKTEVVAAVQSAVGEAVQASLRAARGRLD